MNIRNTLAGLAATGGILLSGHAQADTGDGIHQTEKHTHPHHVAVGAEVSRHAVLGHILYTHELADHWSIGAGVGLGSDRHGQFAGGVEAVGTFHTGVKKPLYVVGEFGVCAEWLGKKVDPVAKITGLIGIRLSEALGFAVGPTAVVTPHGVQAAGTANLAIGF